jgi:hypothetical protein
MPVINPVTGISVPVPSTEPGPAYATEISNALNTLSNLTHTGVANLDGYQIPAAGLNINADVSCQSNNLTQIRSARFTSQPVVLSGTGDVGCLYVDGGDLYYNNTNGTAIPITAGSVLAVTIGIDYSSFALSTNLTISPTATFNLINVNSTTGTVLITLPTAASVGVGRFFIIKDVAGSATTHNITVRTNGDTMDGGSSFALNTPYQATMVVSNGASNWGAMPYDKTSYVSGDNLTFYSGAILTLSNGQLVNNGLLDNYGITSFESGSGTSFLSGSTTTVNSGAIFKMYTQATFMGAQTRNIISPVSGGYSYAGVWTQQYIGVVSGQISSIWYVSLPRVHNGATLNTIAVSFYVPTAHLPATTPSITAYTVNPATGVYSTLATVNPQYFDKTGLSAAQYGGGSGNGTLHTMTFTCTENNVINNSTNEYFILINDETGAAAAAGNIYMSPICNFTNITSQAWSI